MFCTIFTLAQSLVVVASAIPEGAPAVPVGTTMCGRNHESQPPCQCGKKFGTDQLVTSEFYPHYFKFPCSSFAATSPIAAQPHPRTGASVRRIPIEPASPE